MTVAGASGRASLLVPGTFASVPPKSYPLSVITSPFPVRRSPPASNLCIINRGYIMYIESYFFINKLVLA